jgi:hypothetical protein
VESRREEPPRGAPLDGGRARSLRERLLGSQPALRHLAHVHAERDERLPEVRDLVVLGEAQPEVVVLGLAQRLVVASEVERGPAPEHRRGVDEAVAAQQAGLDLVVGGGRLLAHEGPSGRVHAVGPGADERHLGVRVEVEDLPPQPIRIRDVVAVEAGHELAPGEGEPAVEAARHAQVAPVLLDPQARLGERPEHSERAVRGPVVDHEQLPVREGLLEDAVHGAADERLGVEHGHEHGDAWTPRRGCGLKPRVGSQRAPPRR